MIELPEAVNFARQIGDELTGKVVEWGNRGNTPHKFAFYSKEPAEYEAILPGKRIGGARAIAGCIAVALEPGYVLLLGGGGERITHHAPGEAAPAKNHLLLRFTDGAHLSVTVQGWGSAMLLSDQELAEHPWFQAKRISPLTDAYTLEAFLAGFEGLKPDDKRAVKYFAITDPGVYGLGNGCLHDILFRAGLNPRRRAVDTTPQEREAFYLAIRDTLREMAELGGRDTELDLHGRPGRYAVMLDRRAKGQPCPKCGTAIEVIAFLGGKCYFCPQCQK